MDEAELVYAEKSIDELFPEEESTLNRKVITTRSDFKDSAVEKDLEPFTEISTENPEIIESSDELLDYLEQADVYLSYEKYDKAEALLKSAIKKEPSNPKYQLKLLEIYAQKNDIQSFDNQADILFAALDGDEQHELWQDAMFFAKQIGSTHPLFHNQELLSSETRDVPENVPDVEEWNPEQTTDIVNKTSAEEPESQIETNIQIAGLNVPVEEESVDSQQDELESSLSMLNTEFERAKASFSSNEVNHKTDTIEPDGAVAKMISELQKSSLDNFKAETSESGTGDMFLLSDEVGTKLDLARAYMEMGDQEGARDLLNEVIDEGNNSQRSEAKELLEHT